MQCRYAAYVFSGYKSDLNWKCNAILKYTNPCKGCSCCYSKEFYNEPTDMNKRWWHVFLPRKQILLSGKWIIVETELQNIIRAEYYTGY